MTTPALIRYPLRLASVQVKTRQEIPTFFWLRIIAAWALGLGCLRVLTLSVGEDNAFLGSLGAAMAALCGLYLFFLRRLDPAIPITPLLLVFFAKCAISYWLWTTWLVAPGKSQELLQSGIPGTADVYNAVLAVQDAVRYWKIHGFTLWIPESYYLPTNHRLPVHILALPCYLSAPHAEVSIPWNTFYSIVTASTVFAVATASGLGSILSRRVFYFALAMPFSWLTAGLYKDVLLQACMGIVLVALVASLPRAWLFVPTVLLGGALLYGFRLPYMLLTVAVGVYGLATRGFARLRGSGLILAALLVFTLATSSRFVEKYYLDVKQRVYGAQEPSTEKKPLEFPLGPLSPLKRLTVGLLTPFPWTQAFESDPVPWGQIPEYAQVTATLALLGIAVPALIKDLRGRNLLPLPAVFGLTWMLSGMAGPVIHGSYVQVGSIFLLPYACQKGAGAIARNLTLSLVVLLLGNAAWLLLRS